MIDRFKALDITEFAAPGVSCRNSRWSHGTLALLTAALLLALALGAVSARAQERPLALVGGTLFPAPGAAPIEDAVLVLRGGSLEALDLSNQLMELLAGVLGRFEWTGLELGLLADRTMKPNSQVAGRAHGVEGLSVFSGRRVDSFIARFANQVE